MNKIEIIDTIQKVKSQNNVYWMDLLRLAFKYAQKESSNIIKKINKLDRKISFLTIKLGK
tara:strand:- start:724 stop:903 length:180 start_codon:yes stop_codon:yes gene_type:complete